jgi:outer membrane protein OmpA-like peptidoglycan-associated protein
MVSFRQVNKSREYLLGIANNYSHKGISFEAACIESNPGEELELILKNPYSELSISAIGEMVWKLDGWYKCITGIKLKDLDQEAVNKIKALVPNETMVREEPPLIRKAEELSEEEEKVDIVVMGGVSDEIAPEAEIIPPGDKTLSISNKEVDSQAEEKAGIKQFRSRTDKPLVKIIIIGLLVAASALFLLKTLGIIPGIDEKIKQPGVSQPSAVTGQLLLNKGNSGSFSSQDADKPIINTEMKPDHLNVGKPEMSQNNAADRQPPVQRGEIIFELDSDVISPAFHPVIDKFAEALLNDTGAILKVEGYSDSKGPELYNLDLAMRRALEVKKLLMKKGINDRKIKVAVFGESYPVSSSRDEIENAGDRRVDIVMVPSS